MIPTFSGTKEIKNEHKNKGNEGKKLDDTLGELEIQAKFAYLQAESVQPWPTKNTEFPRTLSHTFI